MVQPVQEVPAKLNGKLHSGSGPDIVEQDAGWVGRPNGTQELGLLFIYDDALLSNHIHAILVYMSCNVNCHSVLPIYSFNLSNYID